MRALVRSTCSLLHPSVFAFLVITGCASPEGPVELPPQIALSASSLTLTSVAGTDPAPQTVSVNNSGGGTLAWTATDDAAWLTITPSSTSFTAFIAVTGLAAGTYTATITVSAPGVGNSPQTIPVTLTLTTPPAISLGQTALTFSGVAGGSNPASQTVSLSFSAGASPAWTASDDASWLTVTPASGSGGTQLTAAVNTSGLSAGTHTATIAVSSTPTSNSPQTVSVTLTLTPPPSIGLSATQLTFNATVGSNPANQTVDVTNTGGGTLTHVATDDATWLSLTASNNVAPATLTVSVTSSGLAAGTYTATITVSATGASNSPRTIAVTLVVANAFNGTWVGTTAQDSTIRVVVSNNEITQIYLGWSVASCGTTGATTTNFTSNRPSVSTGSFSRTVSSSPLSYTISGTFSSATSLSGTLTLNFSMSAPFSCSGTVNNLSWSASKQ